MPHPFWALRWLADVKFHGHNLRLVRASHDLLPPAGISRCEGNLHGEQGPGVAATNLDLSLIQREAACVTSSLDVVCTAVNDSL